MFGEYKNLVRGFWWDSKPRITMHERASNESLLCSEQSQMDQALLSSKRKPHFETRKIIGKDKNLAMNTRGTRNQDFLCWWGPAANYCTSLYGLLFYPEDGSTRFLRNFGRYLPNYPVTSQKTVGLNFSEVNWKRKNVKYLADSFTLWVSRDAGVCKRLYVMHYVETLVSLEKLTFVSDGFSYQSIVFLTYTRSPMFYRYQNLFYGVFIS